MPISAPAKLGRFVAAFALGWFVPYVAAELVSLLRTLGRALGAADAPWLGAACLVVGWLVIVAVAAGLVASLGRPRPITAGWSAAVGGLSALVVPLVFHQLPAELALSVWFEALMLMVALPSAVHLLSRTQRHAPDIDRP